MGGLWVIGAGNGGLTQAPRCQRDGIPCQALGAVAETGPPVPEPAQRPAA